MGLNTAIINANDLMRTSIMTKKSFNDVTTLAAQSNAFNLTNMSPNNRAIFNQSVLTRNKLKMQRNSPNGVKKVNATTTEQSQIDTEEHNNTAVDKMGETLIL